LTAPERADGSRGAEAAAAVLEAQLSGAGAVVPGMGLTQPDGIVLRITCRDAGGRLVEKGRLQCTYGDTPLTNPDSRVRRVALAGPST
jgi:hypothetical protein